MALHHPVEKAELEHHEHRDDPESLQYMNKGAVVEAREDGFNNLDDGFDPKEVHRVTRKVDRHLIPILIAMYYVSQADRTNLSQARAANKQAMQKDLKLNEGNNRYGLITLMFFIPYILFEIPSQIGLRKFGVRRWLGFATVAWGAVVLGMGFVHTWDQLLGLRVLLGVLESCLYPGATFLISCWYPRRLIATRLMIFYTFSQSLAGLSSLMSFGISHMHGIRGMSGWRWIFVFYGIITMLIGIASWFFLVDFPHKAKFLTGPEAELINTRIRRDRNDDVPDELSWAKAAVYIVDLKLWGLGFMFGTAGFGIYSFAFFLPRLLQDMGFNNTLCQVLFAPPFVYMIIPGLISARIADRVRNMRGVTIIVNACLGIVGICIFSQLHGDGNRGVRYFGVFLSCGSVNAMLSLVNGWTQASIRSQSKRGFASALVIGWGGVSGILAAVSFIEKEAPSYPTGIRLLLAMFAASVAIAVALIFWFRYQNRRADEGHVVLEGDPQFRYQL